MEIQMLDRLMAADGLDRGAAPIVEPAWRGFVEYVAETLDVGPGTRVFQVNCGAGSLLCPLWENGYVVGGLGRSPELIRIAAEAMPEGRFSLGEASALDPAEPWAVVVAFGTFGSFPDLDYARGVLARMAAKATHAIAVLEVPDIDRAPFDFAQGRPGSPRLRSGQAGLGAPRTASLGNLFYDRAWMFRMLAEIGAIAVQIEDVKLAGRENHFNVFARL
ncbi:MAG: hypothetical protein Q7R30_02035 [Acidobacteriota bacterium]|nr:hypothetical protein [Acidobacteriota bacterium]